MSGLHQWGVTHLNTSLGGAEATTKADWRRVVELYRQLSDIVSDPERENYLPDQVSGELAEQSGRLFAHYHSRENEFIPDLLGVLSEIDSLTGSSPSRFRRLYADTRFDRLIAYSEANPSGRRRPRPFEASVETVRRLTQVNQFRDALSAQPTAAILGGSVSYGRFFNTVGASRGKPSDVDLLVVVPSYDVLPAVAEAMAAIPGVGEESLTLLKRRILIFQQLRVKQPRLILSHKLQLWSDNSDPLMSQNDLPGDYVTSLHVFSIEDFDFLLLSDLPTLTAGSQESFVRELCDYRDTPAIRADNQRDFSGRDFTIPLDVSETDSGFLSRVRVCHIDVDRYYPGLHQNVVLPQYEVRWETPQVRLYLRLLSFRWKLVERLQEERRLRPFEHQTISQSHARSEIFAPHIVRRASRE